MHLRFALVGSALVLCAAASCIKGDGEQCLDAHDDDGYDETSMLALQASKPCSKSSHKTLCGKVSELTKVVEDQGKLIAKLQAELEGQGNASAHTEKTVATMHDHLVQSDTRVWCKDSGGWDNINNCGGGGGDWSCTPWGFTVDWSKECEEGTGCFTQLQCDGNDGGLIMGDDSRAATYIAKWQKADGSWCDSRCDGQDASYFAFHTCDGSGLQTDCKGAAWYVEQLSVWNYGNFGNPQPGQVHPQGSQQVSFNLNHQGTGHNYEWYWCGWWGMADAGWNGWDKSVGWIGATGLNPAEGPTPSWARAAFGGADADATMALYPWICTVDNSADKTGIQKGSAMYAGDHDTGTWNCFCDNNGPNGLPSDSQPPPHYKFYSMKKEVDSDGNSYMHMVGVAGDAINPGSTNDDFKIYGFSDAW